jgi:hypothetical protein
LTKLNNSEETFEKGKMDVREGSLKGRFLGSGLRNCSLVNEEKPFASTGKIWIWGRP